LTGQIVDPEPVRGPWASERDSAALDETEGRRHPSRAGSRLTWRRLSLVGHWTDSWLTARPAADASLSRRASRDDWRGRDCVEGTLIGHVTGRLAARAASRGRRPRRRVVAAVLLAALLAFGAATARLFVWPAQGMPAHVSVIVMLAGPGDRLDKALQLASARRARMLVVSRGHLGYGSGCPPDPPGLMLICFDPVPPRLVASPNLSATSRRGTAGGRSSWSPRARRTPAPASGSDAASPTRSTWSRCSSPGTTGLTRSPTSGARCSRRWLSNGC